MWLSQNMDAGGGGGGFALLSHAQLQQAPSHLEHSIVQAPGQGAQVLQQGALVREGEVEAQVPRVLPEAHLAQELRHAVLVHAWDDALVVRQQHLRACPACGGVQGNGPTLLLVAARCGPIICQLARSSTGMQAASEWLAQAKCPAW